MHNLTLSTRRSTAALNWEGKIIGKNCFGYQKLLIIKKLNFKKDNLYFFTDSKSDMPLINYCKKTYVLPKTLSDKYVLRKYEKIKW